MGSPDQKITMQSTPNRALGEPDFTIDLVAGKAGTVIRCGGRWTVQSVEELAGKVDAIVAQCPSGPVRLDLSGLSVLDTAGALALRRLQRNLTADGRTAEMSDAPPKPASVLKTVSASIDPPDGKTDTKVSDDRVTTRGGRPSGIVGLAETIGRSVFDLGGEARGLIGFLGLIVSRFGRLIMHPSRLRTTSIVFHAEQTGLNAVPIVCLLSFLVGIVIAYQGAVQLQQFGADLFVVNLIGISVLRELGILVTAIILAGRSGSAFTAQIGTMKVNQEVDAMGTIGLDPVEALVLPRLIALLITFPLLTFLANIAGIGGGAVMAYVILDIDLGTFIRQFQSDVAIGHLWAGLVKAPVFAFTIAMVGCYQGLRVTGSAESVGILTTKSVVQSIFLVIVLDAIFSIVLSDWGF